MIASIHSLRPLLLTLFCTFIGTLHAQRDARLDSLLHAASDLVSTGYPDSSMNLYLHALRVAEKLDDKKALANIYYNMGLLNQRQQNNPKADEQFHQALRYAEAASDTTQTANICIMAGIMAFLLEKTDSCAYWFNRSAALFEAIGKEANAAFARSKLGNIYEAQGQYALATPLFEQALKTAQKSQDSTRLMAAYINMATNNLNLQQYKPALRYAQDARQFAAVLGRDFEYQEMLKIEAAVLEEMGNPGAAIEVLRQYVHHHDSVLNIQRTQHIAELETRYETDKKEATIAAQGQALRDARIRFWLIVTLFLLALVGGGLLFRLTRQLRKRNTEKEFLIKEIHHRVKNNLQILSSLLHLQSRQITDEAALDAVREGQNRVDAMGLIHQKLYMGDNVAAVDMPEYLHQLGNTLLESFGFHDDRVQIRYEVQPLRLDVDTAVPLGLIINELVTNALKYAFPEDRPGVVAIALWIDEANKLCLKVADNGVGKGAAPDPKGSTSFGTNLVQMLSKKLKGVPQVEVSQTGYSTLIAFENFSMV
ncbi:MAG: tetratricopeptide repeat protein [Lewinellaceae bacterium]|nr:tetratricopeptide repeat protein [Lewinellaceae bacterium]